MSYVFAVIVAVIIFAVDQLSKYLITQNFILGESIPVINGVLNFTYINNMGAAFGIMKNQTWLLLAVTVVVTVICFCILIKKTYRSKIVFWGILLIISGGLGNIVDRVFRNGNVVDFLELDFIRFPVFNVADCAIVVGAGLLILYFIVDFIGELRRENNIEQNSLNSEEK
ncbi:MAG: signal peptidase II [bacterium]|nr:signal peptidase II [bacterium]